VDEAAGFFKAVPLIREKMETLQRVGLGYIKVGQQATTLSGGEAQRVKLAKELSRRATGRTLYILDEPTTGLHFHDVKKLLEVLHELVDQGNTVAVIEHNLEVIKTADWIIDIGPEGGDGGGEIVATGTPEDVAKVKQSHTGYYLKMLFERRDMRQKQSSGKKIKPVAIANPVPSKDTKTIKAKAKTKPASKAKASRELKKESKKKPGKPRKAAE
jgi:excinuclease ABC subunit A